MYTCPGDVHHTLKICYDFNFFVWRVLSVCCFLYLQEWFPLFELFFPFHQLLWHQIFFVKELFSTTMQRLKWGDWEVNHETVWFQCDLFSSFCENELGVPEVLNVFGDQRSSCSSNFFSECGNFLSLFKNVFCYPLANSFHGSNRAKLKRKWKTILHESLQLHEAELVCVATVLKLTAKIFTDACMSEM